MWIILAVLGIVAMLAGLLIKAPHTRRTLLFLGTLLLVAGLVYGGLTALLLGYKTAERLFEMGRITGDRRGTL